MRINNYICHAPYLRNCISSDNFWYTYAKWWYLQVIFSFFQNFNCLGCYWVKGQNMIQNDKKSCLSYFISQEPCIICLSFMIHLCKMIISPGIFSFYQNFSGLLEVLNGQKIVQNDKKFFPSLSISQEPCTIWLSFMIHILNDDISSSFFHLFKFWIFLVC